MRRVVACLVALLVMAGGPFLTGTASAAVPPKAPPLTTPWTDQVSTTDPLPDYPRPQMTRRDWQSLNGEWEFLNPPTDGAGNVDRNAARPSGRPSPSGYSCPTRWSRRSPASCATTTAT